jgi:hypothetical protein
MDTSKEIHWIMNMFEYRLIGDLFDYLREGGFSEKQIIEAGNLVGKGIL